MDYPKKFIKIYWQSKKCRRKTKKIFWDVKYGKWFNRPIEKTNI